MAVLSQDLISTFVAIPKVKRGNSSNATNYSAITLGTLFCKMFDITFNNS